MKHFLSSLLLLTAAVLSGGPNLLRNSDMLEYDKTTFAPRFWNLSKKTNSGVDTKVTPEKGINSLRIDPRALCTTTVPVKGGHIYKCSFLLKTEDFQWMTAASFQILWYKNGRPMFKGKHWAMNIKNTQGGHNWSKIEMANCEVPAGATHAQIRLLQVFHPSGKCWFAKMRMEEQLQGDPFKNRVAQIAPVRNMTMEKAFDEANWKNAVYMDDFLVPHTGLKAKNPTHARIAYDNDAIWVYFRNIQKGIGNAAKKASRFDNQDCVELFFLPPGQEYQYHILLPRVGKLFTCTEKWNDGNWPMKLHPWKDHGIQTKVKLEKDQWLAVIRIPFKSMKTKAPAPDAEWRGNLCRSVFTGGREESAWSFLKEPHFQFTGDFGKFIFATRSPVIRNITISNDGCGAEITNTGRKPESYQISFVRHNDKRSFVATEKKVTVAPGATQVMELIDKTDLASMRYVEIRDSKGKLIRKHCGMPIKEFLAFSVFDPENIRSQTLYLATDTPFFMAMNMRHSLDVVNKKRRHGLILRHEKAFDLYMELPREIKMTGLTFADSWLRPGLVKPTVKPITRNGAKLNLWKFEMPFIVRWKDNAFIFFYECKSAPDKDLTGNYYFVHNGKAMQKHEMKFRTMKIGKIKRNFKRFLVDPGLLTIKMLTWWLPKDTVRNYKKFGFNWLGITVEKMKNKKFYTGNDPKTNEDYYDLLFNDMKRTGEKLYLKTFITSSGPNSWGWTNRDLTARAYDWNGKHPLNQYNYPALCPGYRGKFYEQWVQRLIQCSAFAKYRITWLGLDLELWPPDVWKKICFCERCLKQFKEFCKKHGRTEYINKDPKKIVSAGKDKAFLAFWERYKQYQHSVFITDCAKRVAATVKGEPTTSPWKGFVVSDWRSPGSLDEGTLNLHEVPLYNSPDNNYLKMKRLMEKCNYRKDVVCSTTFGQTDGCPDFHVREEQIKDNIYECAAFGMQGIVWYYVTSMEPRRLKCAIEGLNTLLPLENLIMDGRISKKISSNFPKYPATRLVLGDESLIGVRTYNADQDVKMKIRLTDLKKPVSVYECETGRKIATITPEKPEFTYLAKKHCCRLLYAGPDAKWQKRNK